mgnify:CR=1 FL=1
MSRRCFDDWCSEESPRGVYARMAQQEPWKVQAVRCKPVGAPRRAHGPGTARKWGEKQWWILISPGWGPSNRPPKHPASLFTESVSFARRARCAVSSAGARRSWILPALRLGWTAASHHRSPVSTGWSYDNENSRPACCSTPDGQRVEKSRQAHLHSHFIILKGVLQCESLKF